MPYEDFVIRKLSAQNTGIKTPLFLNAGYSILVLLLSNAVAVVRVPIPDCRLNRTVSSLAHPASQPSTGASQSITTIPPFRGPGPCWIGIGLGSSTGIRSYKYTPGHLPPTTLRCGDNLIIGTRAWHWGGGLYGVQGKQTSRKGTSNVFCTFLLLCR
ncbi:hypothetical protein BKA61DRAFT_606035 [Leptodontidium sp. MPI-SDFR-AT-0119]|nr:hypothetical protein BKA61DRAFT_606035 [Leptodontidium sp. MPI-SDFR-AT-0119]